MQNFTLVLQFQISGIGSASGIVYKENSLFIISDNSSFLYQYHIQEKELTRIKLFENSQENIPKKEKYDFESISLKGNKLHILGSGSTSKREKRISYHLETAAIKEKDITKLYRKLKKTANISDEDLNIEGSLFHNEKWYLFQRGNSANSQNGIFSVDTFSKKDDSEPNFTTIQLPKIKHIETSFTDAILVEDKIYFLATAEDTTSTYNDGEILGSIIGRIDIQSMQIDFTIKISDTQKFEGLTLFNKTEDAIEFLLCEDNDTEELQSSIYKLTL
ncbi:DUF6929 family protein [Flavobacterium sp.]|uniref:DUF6929 family protein n=1 Tax=Flavobacterium sp. TaxID=239 RepID=UPI0037B262EE